MESLSLLLFRRQKKTNPQSIDNIMIPDIAPAIMGVPEDFDVLLSGCVASSPVPEFEAFVGPFLPFPTLDPFPFVGMIDPLGGTINMDV
jgi:hypothetical protein